MDIEDCGANIKLNLNLVIQGVSENEVCNKSISENLSKATSLLDMLLKDIRTLIYSPITFSELLEKFPTSVGIIILDVFTHCKDSTTVYGANLSSFSKELQDLYKNCQELQSTYLTILERHFAFDLNNKEILLQALHLNLKIAEVVNSTDAKSMAVQLKGLVAICDKYNELLSESSIFEDISIALCACLKSKIECVVEAEDNIERPLKLSKFILKILRTVCNIFKNAKNLDYTNILDVLFYIYNVQCQVAMTAKKSHFLSLVTNPTESLLTDLLLDEVFVDSLLNYDINKVKAENNLVGYVLTIMFVIENVARSDQSKTVTKSYLIDCLYRILPMCTHIFWDEDILFESGSKRHCLYEHLLIHALTLAFTLNAEEYILLEQHMVGAILDTDYISALFSSNLWTLLPRARTFNPQLLFNQVVWLCTMYKKLEQHAMFRISPQKLHLTFTIGKLFHLLEIDDKMKICKQFRIHDDDNISLWTALGVKSLPKEAESAAKDVVLEKLKTQFQCLSSRDPDDIERLTKLLTLAASCRLNDNRGIEDLLMQGWSRTCPQNCSLPRDVSSSTMWFYEYIRSLILLTESLWDKVCSEHDIMTRMLHHVTKLIQHCSDEFKLLFINILCKVATCDFRDKKSAFESLAEAFTCLSGSENVVRNKLFITLQQYRDSKNIDLILCSVEDCYMRESWVRIKDGIDCIDTKEQKILSLPFEYTHKCFESGSVVVMSKCSKVSKWSGNFDFADNIDNIYGNDSNNEFQESPSKRVKLN